MVNISAWYINPNLFVYQFLCSLCTATVFGGSGPNLARDILIPSRWSWAGSRAPLAFAG